MNNSIKNISGIYLVLNPSMPMKELISKLQLAMEGGVSLVQIWNNWPKQFKKEDKLKFISAIYEVINKYRVPILANNDWELLEDEKLDGIHFDFIPHNFDEIKKSASRELIYGITCSNDLARVAWAERNKIDYISFCTMFPSTSVKNCEIVTQETIIKARKVTEIPLFLSGGITLDNMKSFKTLNFQGVAIISGILNADCPEKATKEYYNELYKIIR